MGLPGVFSAMYVFFERWFVFPVYKRTTMFSKSRKSRTVVKLSPLRSPCQLPLVSLNLNGKKTSIYPVQNPFNQVFYTKRRIITWHGASNENHPLQTHVLEHPLVVALVEKVLETQGEAPLGVARLWGFEAWSHFLFSLSPACVTCVSASWLPGRTRLLFFPSQPKPALETGNSEGLFSYTLLFHRNRKVINTCE